MTNTYIQKEGYGKRPWWYYLLLYIVIGGIVYAIVYYAVIKKNGGYSSSPSYNTSNTYTAPSTNSTGY
jgi:hypothetical protein